MDATQVDMQILKTTVDRLARSQRRLRTLAWSVSAVLLLVVFVGQHAATPPRIEASVVQASRLMMMDSAGKLRAFQTTMPDGKNLFVITGQNRNKRVEIEAAETGPANIRMFDDRGRARVVLGVDKGGSPRLSLRDAQERDRVVFGLDAQGEPKIELFKVAEIDVFDMDEDAPTPTKH